MATNCKKKKAGVPGAEFIENDGTHCLEDIDCTSKNKFLWRWLAVKDDNNDYFSYKLLFFLAFIIEIWLALSHLLACYMDFFVDIEAFLI